MQTFLRQLQCSAVTVLVAAFLGDESLRFHNGNHAGNIGFILAAQFGKPGRRQPVGIAIQGCKIYGMGAFQVILTQLICGNFVPIAVYFRNGKGKFFKTVYHTYPFRK